MVALFNFQGAVYIRRGVSLRFGAFFFSEVFVVSLRDSLFIIAHFLSFVNPFSKIFLNFFRGFFDRTSVRFALQSSLSALLRSKLFPELPLFRFSQNAFSFFSKSRFIPSAALFSSFLLTFQCAFRRPLSRGDSYIIPHFSPNVKGFSKIFSRSMFCTSIPFAASEF